MQPQSTTVPNLEAARSWFLSFLRHILSVFYRCYLVLTCTTMDKPAVCADIESANGKSTDGVPRNPGSAELDKIYNRTETANYLLHTLHAKRSDLDSQLKAVDIEIFNTLAELGLLIQKYTMLQRRLGQNCKHSLTYKLFEQHQTTLRSRNARALLQNTGESLMDSNMSPLDIGRPVLSDSRFDSQRDRDKDALFTSVGFDAADNPMQSLTASGSDIEKRNTDANAELTTPLNMKASETLITNPSHYPSTKTICYPDYAQEITKKTLELADNGIFFVDPPIMRGVPLDRIFPGHPYWELAWPNTELSIQYQIERERGSGQGNMQQSYLDALDFLQHWRIPSLSTGWETVDGSRKPDEERCHNDTRPRFKRAPGISARRYSSPMDSSTSPRDPHLYF